MAEVSIKINIAGRTYPIKVEKGREGMVRKAAEQINRKMDELRSSYAVKDAQDLLAMSALQLFTQNLHTEQQMMVDQDMAFRLVEMEAFVSDYLRKERESVN
ncbi:MAG: cell division protein ZapA [Bacteroidia bacterium]|nr:cell division protein ZapA [Bacteroidia bacterium]